MNGTTPPCEMTTSPRSLFNLYGQGRRVRKGRHARKKEKNALLIVPDSELQVPGHNTLLLVITRGVARQLENLGSKVLKDSSKVNYTGQGKELLAK